MFDGFDSAIADIYEARSGMKRKDIEKLMDAETFMGPSEAVEKGFADSISEDVGGDAGASNEIDRTVMARRQTEAALARAGFSRDKRSEILSEIGASAAPRDASRHDAPRDASVDPAALERLIATMKT